MPSLIPSYVKSLTLTKSLLVSLLEVVRTDDNLPPARLQIIADDLTVMLNRVEEIKSFLLEPLTIGGDNG